MRKPNRNDPCTCGSGKKYKKCCGKSTLGRKVTLLSTAKKMENPLDGLFGKQIADAQSCRKTPPRDIKVSQ